MKIQLQFDTTCNLSETITALPQFLWKTVNTKRLIGKKTLNKRKLDFHKLHADSIKQHRTLSSKDCPRAIICRSFTCCWLRVNTSVKTKLSQCVYIFCVRNSQHTRFHRKLPAFGSGKPPKPTDSFNHCIKGIAVEAFDDYQ